MTQDVQLPTQDEEMDFARKLEEFRNSLPERERPVLAEMVLIGSGIEDAVSDQAQGDEVQGHAQPTAEEVNSFQEKVRRFHDSLQEREHQLFDDLVRRYHDKVENDVHGHYHIIYEGWVPSYYYTSYVNDCFSRSAELRALNFTYWQGHYWTYVQCNREQLGGVQLQGY